MKSLLLVIAFLLVGCYPAYYYEHPRHEYRVYHRHVAPLPPYHYGYGWQYEMMMPAHPPHQVTPTHPPANKGSQHQPPPVRKQGNTRGKQQR